MFRMFFPPQHASWLERLGFDEISFGYSGIRLIVDGIEKLEAAAKFPSKKKPAWVPKDCDRPLL
jgi:hypothetical protein